MKKQLFLASALVFTSIAAKAQVDDVSITVAPTASYNWFDSKLPINSNAMWGVEAGFGFGKFIELKGIYEKSINMQQNFGKYEADIQELFPNFNFTERNISVRRIGGELKANLAPTAIAPYILVGTGLQSFTRETESGNDYKVENLYGNAGLGLKFNLSPRAVFNIEGRGMVYNMTPGALLFEDNSPIGYDEWVNAHERSTMVNWSVGAGLQFYLGGRDEKNLTPMERAYLNRFSSGLSGVKFTLTPQGAYTVFNKNTAYKNAYFLGGSLGLDITDFVGIRAYYLHALKDDKISLDFDNLGMFGADFVGKLNVPRGIVPFITVGGGYINVQEDYKGRNHSSMDPTIPVAESGYFAKGGVGVEVPLSKYVEAYGAANLMYTMNGNANTLTSLESVDQLNQHTMYNVGLRFKFGKSADTKRATETAFEKRFAPKEKEYERQLASQEEEYQAWLASKDEEYQEKMSAQEKAYKKEMAAQEKEYKNKIQKLEDELQEAYADNDTERVIRIMEEKKEAEEKEEQRKESSKKETKKETEVKKSEVKKSDLIKMTPSELESLVDKVIEGLEEKEEEKDLKQRVNELERLLLNINQQPQRINYEVQPQVAPQQQPQAQVESSANSQVNQKLIDEIQKLNQQIEEQNKRIEAQTHQLNYQDERIKSIDSKQDARNIEATRGQEQTSSKTVIEVAPSQSTNTAAPVFDEYPAFVPVKELSIFVAPNFGKGLYSTNLGARAYYGFANNRIIFMPEVYAALGKKNGFGISVNGIVPINLKDSRFTPYVGVGAGLNYIHKARFNTNVILGTSYDIGFGSLFADYTVRGAFKHNQVALGYKFRF